MFFTGRNVPGTLTNHSESCPGHATQISGHSFRARFSGHVPGDDASCNTARRSTSWNRVTHDRFMFATRAHVFFPTVMQESAPSHFKWQQIFMCGIATPFLFAKSRNIGFFSHGKGAAGAHLSEKIAGGSMHRWRAGGYSSRRFGEGCKQSQACAQGPVIAKRFCDPDVVATNLLEKHTISVDN